MLTIFFEIDNHGLNIFPVRKSKETSYKNNNFQVPGWRAHLLPVEGRPHAGGRRH